MALVSDAERSHVFNKRLVHRVQRHTFLHLPPPSAAPRNQFRNSVQKAAQLSASAPRPQSRQTSRLSQTLNSYSETRRAPQQCSGTVCPRWRVRHKYSMQCIQPGPMKMKRSVCFLPIKHQRRVVVVLLCYVINTQAGIIWESFNCSYVEKKPITRL